VENVRASLRQPHGSGNFVVTPQLKHLAKRGSDLQIGHSISKLPWYSYPQPHRHCPTSQIDARQLPQTMRGV
jgi:hypothetical protein